MRSELIQQTSQEQQKIGVEEMKMLKAGGFVGKIGRRRLTARGEGVEAVMDVAGTFEDTIELSKESVARLTKQGGPEAVQAAQMALEIAQQRSNVLSIADEDDRADALVAIGRKGGDLYEQMAMMSPKALKGLARSMAGTAPGGMAGEILMRGQRFAARMKTFRGGAGGAAGRARGAVGAVASKLGVTFGKEELAGLSGGKEGMDTTRAAAAILSRAGIEDEGLQAGLEEALAAASGQTGLKGKEAAQAGAAMLDRTLQQVTDPEARQKLMAASGQKADPSEEIVKKIAAGNTVLEGILEASLGNKRAAYALLAKAQIDKAEEGGGGKSKK
jgi:hypothetical protein